MKEVLLVGCGAEIGSSLLGMNVPAKDGFRISATLTNPIPADPKNPLLTQLDSLYARIVLGQPHLLDEVQVDHKEESLVVRGNTVKVYWGDVLGFDFKTLRKRFDLCILATSKKHIGDNAIIGRLLEVADVVVGVSEARQLPAIYANLIGAPERYLPQPPRPIGDNRLFCFGSCQSNGWHGPLRALLELANTFTFNFLDMLRMEIDIVHPDTPTGRLGTKSLEARSQDPRNNFRPSFSQIEMSMNLLFPESCNSQSVSLRTLTAPPGYQISRYFFRYSTEGGKRVTKEDVFRAFQATADLLPATLRMSRLPLGSRAFEFCESSAVVLATEHFLQWVDDPFQLGGEDKGRIVELLVQSYVHNVRAYCRSVLDNIRYLLLDPNPKAFWPAR